MEWLSSHGIDETVGDLIAEMIEFKKSPKLYAHAKDFLTKFPEHEDAPAVVAAWLEASDSGEAARFAALYLAQPEICDDLHPVIRAVFATRYRKQLYDLVNALLEKHPRRYVWQRCIFLKPDAFKPKMETLALRWLTLNLDNPQISIMGVSCARSKDIIKLAMQWLRGAGKNSLMLQFDIPMLLNSIKRQHKELSSEIADITRDWISRSENDRGAGYVVGALAVATHADQDVNFAKQWYLKYKKTESAWCVLSDLLDSTKCDSTDPFLLEEAITVLKSQHPNKRTPRLLGALLERCTDPEVVSLAKEACRNQEMPWILMILIERAGDAESIDIAWSTVHRWIQYPIAARLLLALLKSDPSNQQFQHSARQWLAKNPNDKHANQVSRYLLE